MNAKIDLMGQRFGELTVVESSPWHRTRKRTHWVCECSCGRRVLARADNLRNGRTTRCSICRGHGGVPSVFIEEGEGHEHKSQLEHGVD